MKKIAKTVGLTVFTAGISLTMEVSPAFAASEQNSNTERAIASYQAMQKYFYNTDANLYAETYPIDPNNNPYSYAWPYGQALMATIDMANLPKVGFCYSSDLTQRLTGLDSYWNNQSNPPGYDSYVLAPFGQGGDKFYDDNDWIGLDMMQLYKSKHSIAALDKAKQIFTLEVHGWDTNPSDPDPGGVFWTQASWSQDRNTVSNAPTAELGLYLYKATGDPYYFSWAKKMYDWVNQYMLAPSGLYYDHVDIQGNVNTTEWSYNQGTMVGASVLFYETTGDKSYLTRAESIANSSLNYYESGNLLMQQPDYFNSIYFENLLLLQQVDHNPKYRQAMQQYGNEVWNTQRDTTTGIFTFGSTQPVDLLNQAAMVQIYASLAEENK